MFSRDYGIHTLENARRQHSLSNMSSRRFRPALKRKCTSGGAFNHFVGANGTERNEDAAKGEGAVRWLVTRGCVCASTTSTSTAFHPNRTCLKQNILAILNLTREVVFFGRSKIAGELLRPLREKNKD